MENFLKVMKDFFNEKQKYFKQFQKEEEREIEWRKDIQKGKIPDFIWFIPRKRVNNFGKVIYLDFNNEEINYNQTPQYWYLELLPYPYYTVQDIYRKFPDFNPRYLYGSFSKRDDIQK